MPLIKMNTDRDLDYLDLDDESDQEAVDSSDDEIDILLHGTPEQKRKMVRHSSSVTRDSSSEDDFEKEMNAELNGQVKEIERRRGSVSEAGCSGTSTTEGTEPQRFHDDVYCDSDEEDMVTQGDKKKQQKQLSNDDLLYDPNIDDDNEKWMENQRRSYLSKGNGISTQKHRRLPHSDAVLDCPACMTTLCLDCQRHDVYDNQYRAMFVTNCKVDTSEFLKYPKTDKRSRKRKKASQNSDNDTNVDKFHPVKCEECNTVVAVFDEDEVYHFFNVLASY
ncbi:E2F-associated phosphoprotein-like [Mercenaria mercenaria]|uniref:E2F-associated phosphoprotein-like n=1 Tax=Mercenaria mercenaria TaxID=6596 RepID=UPI00234E928F|nr:E2F-associated phosphoprotein-like [Mercenaria mercenaria]